MPRSIVSFDDLKIDDQFEFQGTVVVDWEIDNTYFVITDAFIEDGYFVTSGTPRLKSKLIDILESSCADKISENVEE